ncbi:MAG TPA: M23 family metallopeptidase [Flavisolibacter sp.]|jgi:murein DD-endopeptidase MepM/ murein hydrolase activator NlpD|nr:M23 family metallopeptidase [Flavisolibacter sp.]
MARTAFFLFLLSFFLGCKPGKGLFGSKRPHEQYAQKLKDAGLDQTALGQQWFAAADSALSSPHTVTLPYRELGYFPAEKPRAAGLRFKAKRGEKLHFQIQTTPDTSFALYVELWQERKDGEPEFLQAPDSINNFTQEAEGDETYILRLQPELLKSGDYTLSISIGPSLDFPVEGGRIGSVWGDERDAGARSHEGIDIFAPKRTPALAAADGIVTSVREGGIGGKVVFMRPGGKAFSLYYAHLDEQLVTNGQRVKSGDTLGLVGNTGNARTTPPHLHFGIYARGGAVNPLPFVNPTVKKPADVRIEKSRLLDTLRTTTAVRTGNTNHGDNVIVFPVAASGNGLRVQLPNGAISDVPASATQTIANAIRQANTKKDSFLLESPKEGSPRKLLVKTETPVAVLGYFSDYAFVEVANQRGWLPSSLL